MTVKKFKLETAGPIKTFQPDPEWVKSISAFICMDVSNPYEEIVDMSELPMQKEFDVLVKKWHEERGEYSVVKRMTNSDSYKKILAMSEEIAVPLIIGQLEKEGDEPDHWFEALRILTGVNPVPQKSFGKIKEMAEAWIDWYRTKPNEW